MKTFPRTPRIAAIALLSLGLLLLSAQPSDGRGGGHGGGHGGGGHGGGHGFHHGGHGHFHHVPRGRVFVGVGPWWWGPPYPYWWDYPPYYVYSPPPVIVQDPPVYIQPPTPPPRAYWYYCPSAKAYYPIAPSCPDSWIQVPARSP